ncbi:hypothetical protein STEG23_017349 [Scotinomys teguina]
MSVQRERLFEDKVTEQELGDSGAGEFMHEAKTYQEQQGKKALFLTRNVLSVTDEEDKGHENMGWEVFHSGLKEESNEYSWSKGGSECVSPLINSLAIMDQEKEPQDQE